ncbi:MAG: hypothetical protein JSS64_11615 [Bacteroidetes bacterium]|nr:hypothetical protein [Bacteroidota bacterium]
MIDGIKATYIGTANSHLPALPCWEITVNESTGKRVNDNRHAEIRNLRFDLKPTRGGGYAFNLAGSLHKYNNYGLHNADTYTMAALQNTISGIVDTFGIDAKECEIHGLEIGVNIPLPYPPIRLLKNIVSFGGKTFEPINKRLLRNGVGVCLDRYSVKVYDKAKQSGVDVGNMLRFEVSVNKMQALEQYGIKTMADLQNPEKVYPLKAVLLNAVKNIVWTDTTVNLDRLTDREQKQWLYYNNPRSWVNINRKKRYYHLKKWNELLSHYGNIPELETYISGTWNALFEAEFIGRLHRPKKENEAVKIGTFALLECTGQTSHKDTPKTPYQNATFFSRKINNINGAKNAQMPPPRCCLSCGKNINHQRPQSRYCSEAINGKAGKKCRNAGSNHRRDLKIKINKAMKNEHEFIAVTYRAKDASGNTYTDTLHVSELHITRDWLDKIERIDLLPTVRSEPPETLTGQAARDYLQLFTNNKTKVEK